MLETITPRAISIFLRSLKTISLTYSLFCFCLVPARSQTGEADQLRLEIRHRVNAHGDEFNGLAKSSDGRRLFIGTEKGDIIVWNIAMQRTERKLHQPSAVHLITALPDPHYIVASGSNHHPPLHTIVRKWNVDTGAFVDLAGLDDSSFPTALASDANTGLVALASDHGRVIVWDAAGKTIAMWEMKDVPIAIALLRRSLYVVTLNRESILSRREAGENPILKLGLDDPKKEPVEFLRVPRRTWTALAASPDGRLLSATYSDGAKDQTVLLDSASKSELGRFRGSASAWIDSSRLLLFDSLDPSEILQIAPSGKAKSIRRLERMKADTDGRALELTGQVASADGARAWATYRKGPGFLEFDFASSKIRTLINGPSGAYAISVCPQDSGERALLTGGADGYVRLWNITDLSLRKEYLVAPSDHFVSEAILLPGGLQAIVAIMRIRKEIGPPPEIEPTEVIMLDLKTGQQKKLLEVKWWRARIAVIGNELLYPDVDRFTLAVIDSGRTTREFIVKAPILVSAVSSNQRWLAVLDAKKTLTVFEIMTGNQISAKATTADEWGPIVITNDGSYVYQLLHEGQLTRWDLQTGAVSENALTRLSEMHTRADFMMLANDDKWVVTAGNHGDVGIFERATGKLVCYEQSPAAVFYAEKVWIGGDRLIFTTDTGVMFEGRLVK